ncbi:MAG: hypothetical protein AAF541_13825 [Pseudomonadota bacterium]
MYFRIAGFVVALSLVSGCGGPLGMIAGGKLAGSEAPFTDDRVPQENKVIALETRPSDPYSVNIGTFVIDGRLYVDPAVERTWYQHMQENPDVRIRFDGEDVVYTARAYPVEDASVLAKFEADRVVLRLGPR